MLLKLSRLSLPRGQGAESGKRHPRWSRTIRGRTLRDPSNRLFHLRQNPVHERDKQSPKTLNKKSFKKYLPVDIEALKLDFLSNAIRSE